MDVSYLLDSLNDKQREAVAAPRSNLLVLAGAGSGKTRVLVHRIAWLMSVENCSPYSIMAVTFTNKAAAEMRHRIGQLMGTSQGGMWVGTFHGLAHRLLRAHHMDANLPQDFQILDSEDQLRLLKRLIKAMNLDEKQWPPRQAMWYINSQKDEGLRPHHIQSYGNPVEQTWQKVYQAYQEACDRAGLVDFAELLLRAHELWLNKPHILQHYRERFTNILVDEFQDTNNIQYAWIRLLAGDTGKVMIVGDDDQSIYGWRGAQVENIQRFLNDFPGAETIRLEQNYRSTSNILSAANALIENNNGRLGKKLWTDGADGEPISLYCAFNELDEARFVVNRIKTWQDNGGALEQCAILYRSNAQSRVLEEALLQASMPYRIYGGMRFFERQEIKDALSYLRLIANRNDDAAFERVVNTPTRGIGDRTLDVVRQTSRDRQLTLWQASRELLKEKALAGRAASALQRFMELIDALAQETTDMPLHVQTDRVLKDSGLRAMYEQEKGEKGQTRIENLEELVTATRQFSYNEEDEDLMPLQAFLSHAALEAGEGQADTWQDNGGALAECAILYRSNAQSRVLEEALLQASMPYRIYGGMRFFERQEIKDALSYLRLIANRNDDAAFERVVNTPTRGIGDRTLDVVRQTSRDRQLTLWQACRELLQEKALAGRAASALQRFMELIDALAQETADMPLHVQTDRVIKDSGLRTMYEQEKGEKGQTRIENLEELVTATRQFSYNEEDEDLMPLQAFLSHAALEAGEGQADTWQDAVQLMTLHSAKGLEFPQVFIVGMEEGMFPSQMSLDEGGRLEEERRLAYVGVTRAMQKLTLTYAETRRLYGKEVYHRPSRFIGELPEECVEEVRLRATVSRPVSHQRMGTPMVENDSGYKLGQRVRHAKFGEGTIVNMEGSGEHSRLQVAFQGQGIKWLVAAYARLESV